MNDEFKKIEGVDLKEDSTSLQRLDDEAEKIKKELSNLKEIDINIPFITVTDGGPKNLSLKLSRAKLEELSSKYIERAVEITKKVVKDAKFELSDIDEIIMVGGQTRMPKIVEEVEKLFNGKKVNQSINPDEVVSMGAAIQAGILQGDVKDILLLDVTPLSLGIETLGGVNTVLIEKNSTIPAKKTQVFSTAGDNQTSTDIHIVQGERSMAVDNKSLGRFILDGIPPAPRGVPQIEVIFDIDANGILKVSAKDKTSGKENSIRIEGSSGLSDKEVEKMKKDAEVNAEEDKKKKEVVDVKNQAESVIIMAEKSVRESTEKLSEELKKDIDEKVQGVKKSLEGDNIEEIKKATDQLNLETQKIMIELQKQQAENSKTEEGKETDKAQEAEVVKDEKDGEEKKNTKNKKEEENKKEEKK